MSASPMARQATSNIPTRRVVVHHENDMPTDYGTTPGGTMFGTTPGGTRIIYERAFLHHLRNSPLSRTPPTNMPVIPGVTTGKKDGAEAKGGSDDPRKRSDSDRSGQTLETVTESAKEETTDEQFQMDM